MRHELHSIEDWRRESARADRRSRERREAGPARRPGVRPLEALAMAGQVVTLLLLGAVVVAFVVVVGR